MKSLRYAMYLILFLAVILPSTFANDETIMGTNTTLWSDVLNGANYYSATSANITIYNAQAVIIVNNQPMTLLATGRYYYQFVPNSTGIFYTFTQYSNTTSLVATASSTFYVAPNILGQSDSMAGLGVILAIAIAVIAFGYLSFMWKSEDNGTTAVWRVLAMIVFVLLLVLLAWSSISANDICVMTYDSTSPTGYSAVCDEGSLTQGSSFLKLMLLVTTIFFIWLSVALFIASLNHLRSTGKY